MEKPAQTNPHDLTYDPDAEEREQEEGLPPTNDTGDPADLTYDPK